MTTNNENQNPQDRGQMDGLQPNTGQQAGESGFFSHLTQHERLSYLLGVLVILVAAVGVWYWQDHRIKTATQGGVYQSPESLFDGAEQNQTIVLSDGTYYSPPVLENVDYSKAPVPNATVQWKDAVKLKDLGLVFVAASEPIEGADNAKIQYYELGSRAGNKVIVAQAPAIDIGGPTTFMFEQTNKGYVLMLRMSSQEIYRGVDSPGYFAISPKVISSDIKTFYAGLMGPEKLNWNGIALELPTVFPASLFNLIVAEKETIEGFSFQKVATIAQGDLYIFLQESSGVATNTDSEKFFVRRYVLKLPSGYFSNYITSYDFFTDNQIPQITWADGTKNGDMYSKDATLGGCGNIGAYIVAQRDITNDLKVAGKTSTGVTVYDFKDINNKTLSYFYELQGGKIYNTEKGEMETISKEEWYKHHPVIALKNGLGEYMLMTNSNYGIMAECGKPVVYLYPTKPTVVTVKVGAKITVSEPEYGKGWKVLADPSGALMTADGKTYNSLFWEGLGFGDYPQVTSGTVVAREDVEQTLTEQLSQLGLNEQESKDFKDFWLSKMPDSPYVRLTWFGTSQMDQLAPLVVLPRPDTVIRVFLDYEGLDRFANIPAQELTSLPRKGFTVVEWGGLLRK